MHSPCAVNEELAAAMMGWISMSIQSTTASESPVLPKSLCALWLLTIRGISIFHSPEYCRAWMSYIQWELLETNKAILGFRSVKNKCHSISNRLAICSVNTSLIFSLGISNPDSSHCTRIKKMESSFSTCSSRSMIFPLWSERNCVTVAMRPFLSSQWINSMAWLDSMVIKVYCSAKLMITTH